MDRYDEELNYEDPYIDDDYYNEPEQPDVNRTTGTYFITPTMVDLTWGQSMILCDAVTWYYVTFTAQKQLKMNVINLVHITEGKIDEVFQHA